MISSRASLALCLLSVSSGVLAQGEWRAVPNLSVRGFHTLAYDVVRQRVVLFSGQASGLSRNNGFEYFDDTWEWDGRRWELKSPLHSPEPRKHHAMAWDPVRQVVLLFGGYADNPWRVLGDTWEWDGQDWRQLAPSNSPSPRLGAGMATDFTRGRIVLFGGGTSLGWFGTGLGDTWEWDGSRWTQQYPTQQPAARQWPGMAHMPSTGRTVMYGGQDGAQGILDAITWEWDGQDWIPHPSAPLGFRSGYIMVTHPSGQSVLLVEGGAASANPNTCEIWEWDGSRWQQLQLTAAPTGPGQTAVVTTDMSRGEVVMSRGAETWAFAPMTRAWRVVADWTQPSITPCGISGVAHDPLRDEFLLVEPAVVPPPAFEMRTWRLRHNRFERLYPPQSPPWRTNPFMTWHAGLGRVFLFGGGGSGCGPRWNDTWLWDGRTWQEHQSAQRPPAQWAPVVYDSRRDRVVLLAGNYGPPETWEWEPRSGWRLIPTANRPSQRTDPLMAYDPRRGRTVLHGGLENTGRVTDTWEYDGMDWQQIQTTRNPSTRPRGFEYVEPLGGVVAVDWGHTGAVGTWLFDGQDWRQLATDGEPAHGAWFEPLVSAYDTNRQRLRLFYREHEGPAHMLWDWKIRNLNIDQPRPHPGETVRFELSASSQATRPWFLGLAFGNRPAIPLRFVPFVGTEVLPLAPDALLLYSLQTGFGGVLDARGKGSFFVPIPNVPALDGVEIYAAAVTLGTGGQIGMISNGLQLEVVR